MKEVKGWYLVDDEIDIVDWLNTKADSNEFWQGKDWIDTILSFSKSKRTFLDIGANYGFVSSIMSRHFDNVYAFELIPLTYECLEKNMEKYSNVKCFNFGIGNEDSKVWTLRRRKTAGHSQVINDQEKLKVWLSGNHNKSHRVDIKESEIKRLDSINFANIDVIKIDVEGFEEYVLEGAIETIKKHMPAICLEVSNPTKISVIRHKDCVKILEDIGYKVLKQIRHDYFFIPNTATD